jgi:hypothetical protein
LKNQSWDIPLYDQFESINLPTIIVAAVTGIKLTMKIPTDNSEDGATDGQHNNKQEDSSRNSKNSTSTPSAANGVKSTADSLSSSTSAGRIRRKMSHHHSNHRASKQLNVVKQKKVGMVSLQPERLAELIRHEPVQKYYTIEEEPIGR